MRETLVVKKLKRGSLYNTLRERKVGQECDIYLIDRYSYLEDMCQLFNLNDFIFRSKEEEREGFWKLCE